MRLYQSRAHLSSASSPIKYLVISNCHGAQHAPFWLNATVVVVLLFCLCDVAAGQSRCDSREGLIAQLAERYRETPVAWGVDSGGGLVEVLAAVDGSTWTIIVTSPQGRSCMVAAGEGWRAVPQLEVEPET